MRVARPKQLSKLPDGRRWTLAPGEFIDFEVVPPPAELVPWVAALVVGVALLVWQSRSSARR